MRILIRAVTCAVSKFERHVRTICQHQATAVVVSQFLAELADVSCAAASSSPTKKSKLIKSFKALNIYGEVKRQFTNST